MKTWKSLPLALVLVCFTDSNGLGSDEERGSIKIDSEPPPPRSTSRDFLPA